MDGAYTNMKKNAQVRSPISTLARDQRPGLIKRNLPRRAWLPSEGSTKSHAVKNMKWNQIIRYFIACFLFCLFFVWFIFYEKEIFGVAVQHGFKAHTSESCVSPCFGCCFDEKPGSFSLTFPLSEHPTERSRFVHPGQQKILRAYRNSRCFGLETSSGEMVDWGVFSFLPLWQYCCALYGTRCGASWFKVSDSTRSLYDNSKSSFPPYSRIHGISSCHWLALVTQPEVSLTCIYYSSP